MTHEEAGEKIRIECALASLRYPTFHSRHEGWAVLLEEVEELWDEIKLKNPDPTRLQEEAIQIGAMAMRFLVDLL